MHARHDPVMSHPGRLSRAVTFLHRRDVAAEPGGITGSHASGANDAANADRGLVENQAFIVTYRRMGG